MQDFKKFLNPIYSRLEQTLDTSNISPSSDIEREEFEYLKEFIRKISRNIYRNEKIFNHIEEQIEEAISKIESETGDDKDDAIKLYNQLLSKMSEIMNKYNRDLETLDMPYFGRIDFKEGESQTDVYIGKFAYFDQEDGKLMITDWRAPISNLYYMNSGPKQGVSFNTPQGERTGDLVTKRLFEASGARIHNIYDAKSGNAAADEFLLGELEKKTGSKMTDIVSTIQEQQNSIIRDTPDKSVIIQGVAGSGKTTIILHKIAYMLYTFKDRVSAPGSLIIAPNSMFLDYISDVLPSLGIEGIQSNTYLFWAKKMLGYDQNYILRDSESDSVKKFKGSLEYLKLVDEFFEEYVQKFFEEMPSTASFDVAEAYEDFEDRAEHMNFLERVNLAVDYTFSQRRLKAGAFANATGKNDSNVKREKQIRSYVSTKSKVYNLYHQFVNSDTVNSSENPLAIEASKATQENIKPTAKAKPFSMSDLPALLWLHYKLNGLKDSQYDTIIIDEAQDMSVFAHMSLYACAKNGSVTFAGDVAQSIVPPYHIADWNVLDEAIRYVDGDAQIDMHQLNRCYRTTVEIIDYANSRISKRFPKGYKLPEAVLRHGDPVTEVETHASMYDADPTDIQKLIAIIESDVSNNPASIALICKDREKADKLFTILEQVQEQLPMSLHNYSEENYQGGILVLPVASAKGLEFDSVVLIDGGDDEYHSPDDARLLYVALTRALHRVYSLTTG